MRDLRYTPDANQKGVYDAFSFMLEVGRCCNNHHDHDGRTRAGASPGRRNIWRYGPETSRYAENASGERLLQGPVGHTQLRNSGGVKFADGYYVLATLVDTSGYSTDIQAKYSAYLIAEVPVKIGGSEPARRRLRHGVHRR